MALATSVFSMVDTLILREPFAGSNNVFRIEETPARWTTASPIVSARHVLALRNDVRFSQTTAAARNTSSVRLGVSGEAVTVPTIAVAPNYFRVLGVTPLLGRSFDESDAFEGGPPTIVITYSLWQSRFGGSPDVIDKPTMINGQMGRVIGVMPNRFSYPRGAEIWTPISASELSTVATNISTDWPRYHVFGKITRQAGLVAQERQLQSLARNADLTAGVKEFPQLRVLSLRNASRRDNAEQLSLWIALSALVVTLCGVNLATMSLAQGIRRRHEIAVRSALGASSWQLAGMLIVDVVVVAVLAGTIAFLVSLWLSGFVQSLVPNFPSGDATPIG
jgi:hypothetical protein